MGFLHFTLLHCFSMEAAEAKLEALLATPVACTCPCSVLRVCSELCRSCIRSASRASIAGRFWLSGLSLSCFHRAPAQWFLDFRPGRWIRAALMTMHGHRVTEITHRVKVAGRGREREGGSERNNEEKGKDIENNKEIQGHSDRERNT